jgi:DNA-directed RNA polymerase specialized sigma subunit
MTENRKPEQRDISTQSGNYNEQVGRSVINKADTVIIIENFCSDQTDPANESNGTQKAVAKEQGSTHKAKAAFILTGTIDAIDEAKLRAIEAHLRKISGDADLTIFKIEEGSIRLILEGSQEGLERLEELFKSGELTEVLGIPVEDVQFVTSDISDNKKSRLDNESKNIELGKSATIVQNAIETNKQKEKLSNWIKKLTIPALRRLKLAPYYPVAEIKSDIFLLIYDLVNSGKLECEFIKDNFVFTQVKSDGTREPIRDIEAWLRGVLGSYLLRARAKEKLDNQVILFDELPDQRISPLDYAQNTELREKLTLLSNEERRILELFFFDELSFQEIAVRLQAEGFPKYTTAALRKKKQRAIEELRKLQSSNK